jgi:Terpene cyclase DEP1
MSGQTPLSPRQRLLVSLYLTGSIVGLVGTWYYNFRFDGDSYLGAWFANDAAASAAVDVIVVAFIATVWMFVESRRIGLRGAWIHALTVPTIALAFSFPLFLGRREYHLARHGVKPRKHGK